MIQSIGKLPVSVVRGGDGRRKAGDDPLVYEVSTILRSVMNRKRRYAASGFQIDINWLKQHLDDDDLLTRRVLTGAGCSLDKDGDWVWKRGLWKLSDVTDLEKLGDLIVDAVDRHRPV